MYDVGTDFVKMTLEKFARILLSIKTLSNLRPGHAFAESTLDTNYTQDINRNDTLFSMENTWGII